MNTRLLRKIAKHIAAEPRRYDQDSMLRILDEEDKAMLGKAAPPCGTIGCIAGWACVLTAKTPRQARSFSWNRARKAIGLKDLQAVRLFAYTLVETNGWPEKFRDAYRNANTRHQMAKVAVARIEHFIKTKGAE